MLQLEYYKTELGKTVSQADEPEGLSPARKKALKHVAHRIRGASATVGLDGLASLTTTLENACNQADEPRIESVTRQLLVLLQEAPAVLRNWSAR
ncbi:MAG: Hpt domain-containing protein [Limnobacter sp.]|nr:Hpt domain-containing protein [Limnobacter sp.]